MRSTEELYPKKISNLQAMNMILLACSQITKTTVKNCFIKSRFAHPETDDNEGDVSDNDDTINEDDMNLLRAETNFDECMD